MQTILKSYKLSYIFIFVILLNILLVNSSEINNFTTGSIPQNISFIQNENLTRYINVSSNSNLTIWSATLDLQGFEYHNLTYVNVNKTNIGYNCTGTVTNCDNAGDDDFSTYATVSADNTFVYLNYSIPTDYVSLNATIVSKFKDSRGVCLTTGGIPPQFSCPFELDIYNPVTSSWVEGFQEASSLTVTNISTNISNVFWNTSNLLQLRIDVETGSLNYYASEIKFFGKSYPNNITINSGNDSNLDYTNYSLFDITATNIDLNTTALNNWKNLYCSTGWCNLPITFASTQAGKLEISNLNISINEIPRAENITLSPLPASENNNITVSWDFYDGDNGTETKNETKWYNNTVEVTSLKNQTTILSGNTSNGQQWFASARVFDGISWGNWFNTSVLTINDSIAPTITNGTLSATTIFNDQTLNISANCSDALSNLNYFKFTLQTPTLTFNRSFTIDTTQKTANSSYKLFENFETANAGSYSITKLYCQDSSGNLNELNQSLNFTVQTRSAIIVGGGGSSTTVVTAGNFTVLNNLGGDSYSFPIVTGTSIMKVIEITNLGDTTLTMTVECESEDNSCDWVEFSQTKFDVLANKLIPKMVVAEITIPEGINQGEEYSFNVIVKDQESKQKSLGFAMQVSGFQGYLHLGIAKLTGNFFTIPFSELREGAEDINIPNWIIVFFGSIFMTVITAIILNTKWIRAFALIYLFPIALLYIITEPVRKNKFPKALTPRLYNFLIGANILYTFLFTFALILIII